MTTKHTHQTVFGRRVEGCPRCEELKAGARPVEWSGTKRAREDREQMQDIEAHFASEKHRSGGCGPVCTYGEW